MENPKIEIEKDVPIPERFRKPRKYPFHEMDIGDSFFIGGRKSPGISGSFNHATKITRFKFISRAVDGGVRVWRIE